MAENGALLYEPGTGRETVLAPAPPEAFVARLRERGVQPLSVGRSIVASWEPMQDIVLETIRELGLELQIVFNKGAVMVLPSGVNKASGLAGGAGRVRAVAAQRGRHRRCRERPRVPRDVRLLGRGRERARQRQGRGRHGHPRRPRRRRPRADRANCWRAIWPTSLRASARHRIPISAAGQGEEFFLRPNGGSLLVAGISGGGKSTLVTGVLERLVESAFQFCVVDPEGDYSELEDAVVLGDARQQPRVPGGPGHPAPAGQQRGRQHAGRRTGGPAELSSRGC